MKKSIVISLVLCFCLLMAVVFSGCGNGANKTAETTQSTGAASVDEAKTDGIDYMVLVNKTHVLPDDWEEKLETVHMTNTVGNDVEVEKKAYDAYLKLKEALESEGVYVDLDSARRSVADQQRIMDEFTEEYGADYAAKTVAKPGYSEHHTGLALDLYLIIDGKDVDENEDMMQYPEIWEKIHAKLADYGFILRYLQGREHITGYGYEPWHIRYLDNMEIAKEITSKDITFEEYLGTYNGPEVNIDLGDSKDVSEEDLENAVVQVKCQFAYWDGFVLYSIRYAGDDAVADEKIAQLKEKNPKLDYSQTVEFLMDFRTPADNKEESFESNNEYTDYQWYLAKNDKGGWEIVDSGYGE